MIVTTVSLVCLALCAEPETRSELLPQTPPDWPYERIDFPLPFAPQIKYDGFEEIRFAPGMFDAKSDTYFTYIFAMKITNDVSIDASVLESLLQTYYRGLCRTVAEGTDFTIDVSKISATVHEDHDQHPQARYFTATVSSFDPFVTGKSLKLHLEMVLVEPSRTDHRLFAAVSPQPLESPVWKLLRKFKRDFQAPAKKPEN